MKTVRANRIRALVKLLCISAVMIPVFAKTSSNLDEWSELKSGRQIYRAACSTCHGSSGTGASRAELGFETEVPDFTDCDFTSREPHGDWVGIVTEGGPTRGFDRMMPAFGGGLRDDQIDRVVSHVKGFCKDKHWPPGEFNIPRALKTGKAYPEDEFVWFLECTVEEPVKFVGKFIVEKRLGKRQQIEVMIPVGVQQLEVTDDIGGVSGYRVGEGIGDVALAWKGVLWHHLPAGTIGSLAAEVFFPTGDEKDGFSDGIFKFEPFLAIGQLIPGDNFVQLQAGAELSTKTSVAKHEVFWRGAVGHTFTQGTFGRAWSPIVEVLGSKEIEDGSEIEWNIVPSLHLTLNARQHIMLNIGASIPVNDFSGRQITVMASLLWDFFDGGFAEGW